MTPLVLLSGWGIDARIWQPLAPHWSANQAVHAPDWPGYGERLGVPVPASLDALADSMCHDLPPSAIWVGWSLGGLLAGALLDHLPPPRGLVLLGIGERFCRRSGVTSAELATFRRAFNRHPHATWQHFLRWQLLGEPAPRLAHRRLLDLIGHAPPATLQALATGLEQLSSIDLTVQLSAPPCPIHRIAGAHDPLAPTTERHQVDSLLADTGHCPMLTRPDDLAQLLSALADEAGRVVPAFTAGRDR